MIREIKVRGKNNREIASYIVISRNTVIKLLRTVNGK